MECCQTLNGLTSINTNSLTLDSTALIDNSEFLALDGIDTTQTIQQQIDAIVLNGGQLYCGSFLDTTTQTNDDVTNGNYMSYNTTDTAATNGVYVSSTDSTKIYIPSGATGVYQIQFSTQILKSTGGNALVYIWLVINGTQVPDSAGQIQIAGNGTQYIEGWNWQQYLAAGDYFQIKWHCDNTQVSLVTIAAVYPSAESPSVGLTVFKLAANGQNGSNGSPGTPGTPGLVWRGTYNAGLSYAVNDAVALSGTSYICTVAQPAYGSNPESLVGWNVLALKGTNGLQGPTGPQGPQGTQGPAGPKGSDGSQGPVGPIGMNWRGPWDETILYNINDGVFSLSGAGMICIQQAQGNAQGPALAFNAPTPNNAYWQCFADHGLQGIQGERGDQGPKGNNGEKGPEGPQGPAGGLDPVSAATLAATALAASVSTAKLINVNIPPLTIPGLTTITGQVNIVGALDVPEATIGTILATSINSPTGLVEIDGIQVVGQSNLNNVLITDGTIRNLVINAAGEEHDILTINDVSRDSTWYDGHDGHPIFKVSTRHPTAGLETDNQVNFYCQTNLNYTSLVSQPMTFKAVTDEHNFAIINPAERRIEYFGPAGLTDFLYDGTLRQTAWYDITNVERLIIKTKATGGVDTDNVIQCKMNTINFGDIVDTQSIGINGVTLIIGNQATDIEFANDAITTAIGNGATNISIASNATDLTVGNRCTTTQLACNIGGLTPDMTLEMGSGIVKTQLGLSSNNLEIGDKCAMIEIGEITRVSGYSGEVIIGQHSDNVDIGYKSQIVDMGRESLYTAFAAGAASTTLGADATTIDIGEYGTTTHSSTTTIGKNSTSAITNNTIKIGAGLYSSDITIGSSTATNQSTTINGPVTFTGDVTFTAGNGNFNLGDFMDQMWQIF
jgi:hypothetical protein